MVNRTEVTHAYRFMLGREPESEAAVDNLLPVPTWANLRERFLDSAEFRTKAPASTAAEQLTSFVTAAPNDVDIDVEPEQFRRLIAHVQATWELLGEERPHWSVLTNPRFLPSNIEANLASFYESGASTAAMLVLAATRAGKVLPRTWTCFELGCGVGRVTYHLAQRFETVVAADISRHHLDLAAAHLAQSGVDNVDVLQTSSLDAYEALEPFDLFFSVIVLQHNPPPLIDRLLRLILAKIKPGGCAYFQVPVGLPGYHFDIDAYLALLDKGETKMEMHVLPKTALFRLLDEQGFRILDFQRDNWTGPTFHSVSVLAERKAS